MANSVQLYFQDPVKKTFSEVPNGGLLIYYQDRGDAAKVNGGMFFFALPTFSDRTDQLF